MLSTLLALALALPVTYQGAAPAALPPPLPVGSVTPIDPGIWTTPGARIPDVELPRVDGQGLVRLKDYEGKRLLLIQFASW